MRGEVTAGEIEGICQVILNLRHGEPEIVLFAKEEVNSRQGWSKCKS